MVDLARQNTGLTGAAIALATRVQDAPTGGLDRLHDRLVGADLELAAVVQLNDERMISHAGIVPQQP